LNRDQTESRHISELLIFYQELATLMNIHRWSLHKNIRETKEVSPIRDAEKCGYSKRMKILPGGRTLTVAPDASWMDLMVAP
jgi:hypothetical protein